MFRKTVIRPLVVSIAAVVSSLSQAAGFDVRIAGTAGTKFSGHYLLVAADGDTRTQQLDGTVPLRVRLEGQSIVVRLKKRASGGKLKVALHLNGKAAGQGMTAEANGYVTVSASKPDPGLTSFDYARSPYRHSWPQGWGGSGYDAARP